MAKQTKGVPPKKPRKKTKLIDPLEVLARNVTRLREARGLSKPEAAEEAKVAFGIQYRQWCRIEQGLTGAVNLNAVLPLLAAYFDVSLAELFKE